MEGRASRRLGGALLSVAMGVMGIAAMPAAGASDAGPASAEGEWQPGMAAVAPAAGETAEGRADASPVQIAALAHSARSDSAQQAERFSKHAIWRVTLPASGASVCYDFDSATVVPECQGTEWDLKLVGGRRVRMFTNSGANGAGRAGVYVPSAEGTRGAMQSWPALASWKSASQDPQGHMVPDYRFAQDRMRSAFSGSNRIQSAVFEHALAGMELPYDQRFYPSYRVFLINSDVRHAGLHGSEEAPVFALQVIGYYGESGHDEGHVQLRWVDRRTPANLRQATIDSSRGWVYLDLQTGHSSNVDDGRWHIAFRQHQVRLRGGDSARGGTVGGMIGMTSPRLYDEAGRPKVQALMNARPEDFLADLTSSGLDHVRGRWLLDRVESRLSPRLMVTPERSLDFGWYVEYPDARQADATGLPARLGLRRAMSNRGALVRSGEGNSFARFHLSRIDYQDPADTGSPQTWTFDFDVQPAAEP